MKVKRRLNKRFYILVAIIILVPIISTFIYNDYRYKHSDKYKLLKIGYEKEDVEIIKSKNKVLEYALNTYNEALVKIVKSKYFIESKLEQYINYYNKYKTVEINKIISIVNVNRDKDFYTNIVTTNNENFLILVNKYYKVENTFVPSDLVDVSISYAYSGHKIRSEVNDKFIEMAKAAKKEGLTLIINSSYRSYEKQEETYNGFSYKYGKEKADELAARPGHSEHQTGLAVDITTKLNDNEEFKDTEEFTWLKNNAYKYGFILRYPEGLEDITGYTYEPWHYRYVGADIAKKIYELNITYDEYYAFYIENK